MFSPAERRYLAVIARNRAEDKDSEPALAAAFPNPVYRRKLLWGIRKKAALAAADWELFAGAARAEERVLPKPLPTEIPLAEDPLVTLLHRVQDSLAGVRSRPGKRARRARPPAGKKGKA